MLTPTYDWDDVPEPTDADLAEIDAAIDSAPVVPDGDDDTFEAWTKSYAVRKTVELVGHPDGSVEWLIDFTSTLFGFVENIAEKSGSIDADEMYEMAQRWRNADGHGLDRHGRPAGTESMADLRRLVEALGIPALARFLNTTETQVERWLFPRAPLANLAAAKELYLAGTPLVVACREAGVSFQTYTLWSTAWRCPGPQLIRRCDGALVLTAPEIKDRILELAQQGIKTKAAKGLLETEFGIDELKYKTVEKALQRARKAVAA